MLFSVEHSLGGLVGRLFDQVSRVGFKISVNANCNSGSIRARAFQFPGADKPPPKGRKPKKGSELKSYYSYYSTKPQALG
jgi:hypothetical protein